MASTTPNLGLRKIDLTDAPPDITVLNDNWDKLDLYVKPLIVTFTDNNGAVTADKSFTEVKIALNAGRQVRGSYNQAEYPMVYVDDAYLVFSLLNGDTLVTIIFTSDNTVQVGGQMFAPHYSYGEGDLTPGVSPLASGTLRFVYED